MRRKISRKIKLNKKRRSRADLTKRLAGYSLTAGIVLASGGKARAGIIYSGPMDQSFGIDYEDYDLTMEGTNPEARFSGDKMDDDTLQVKRLNDNFNVEADSMNETLYMLPAGSVLGPSNTLEHDTYGFFYFHSSFSTMTTSGSLYIAYNTKGNWNQNGQEGYFGFSFDLENESAGGAAAGATVYGWGLVEKTDGVSGRLLGWAYEDSGGEIHVGDTGIPAVPVPSALGIDRICLVLKMQRGIVPLHTDTRDAVIPGVPRRTA